MVKESRKSQLTDKNLRKNLYYLGQSAKTADWSINNDVKRVTFLNCGCARLLTELDRSTIRRLTSQGEFELVLLERCRIHQGRTVFRNISKTRFRETWMTRPFYFATYSSHKRRRGTARVNSASSIIFLAVVHFVFVESESSN